MSTIRGLRKRGTGSIAFALIACFVLAVFPRDLPAQSTAVPRLVGSFAGSVSGGGVINGSFHCAGTPNCIGTYEKTAKYTQCSNTFQLNGELEIAGLNLAAPGALSGSFAFKSFVYFFDRLADGSCAFRNVPFTDAQLPYTGFWSGTAGTFTLDVSGAPVPGNFTAYFQSTAPVFPMVVRSTIDSVVAAAAADIQFRPQDVGTSGSVFTFAVAPANLVKEGFEPKALRVGLARGLSKDGPSPSCVVAQFNSAGQLIAVTTGQLIAYLSGTLSGAGASVTILGNVPTPTVAGATFYVGYGSSSSAMITNGVYRIAVTVPGTSICPMLSSQTALWWNPAESGWGLNLNHQGDILFGTLFTYDANRVPLWLVMSGGAMQSDGVTFTGDLYRTTGPAFNANPFTPIGAANITKVGAMTVAFRDVNSGTLRYTVNGTEVNKAIERQVFGSRAAACFPAVESRATATSYQDLWWAAPASSESGWGINITHQDDILFATLFTYDATGRDLWLVMSAGTKQPDGSYFGDLYRTSGPPFNSVPFTPIGAGDMSRVGTMRLHFTGGNSGTLAYTYNGVAVTKAITRQVFSSPVPLCH